MLFRQQLQQLLQNLNIKLGPVPILDHGSHLFIGAAGEEQSQLSTKDHF